MDTDAPLQASADPSTGESDLKCDDEDSKMLGQMTAPRNHPNTIDLSANIVMRECEHYINSLPGRDSMAKTITFHWYVRGFINKEIPPTQENLRHIYTMVIYRNNLAKLATQLLDLANIPTPNGTHISDFDREAFVQHMSARTESRYSAAWQNLRSGPLARPVRNAEGSQGHLWDKPLCYIAAAIARDSSIQSRDDISEAVDCMAQCYREILQDAKTQLEQDRELTRNNEA